jgi:two-component system, cell cycle sensor histidine kinase and response regulator CckA
VLYIDLYLGDITVNMTNTRNQRPLLSELSISNHNAHSILVMDDEEIIRKLAASMLKRLGYKVTTCANGDEAIVLYRNAKMSGNPYLAVIMDLTIFGGMGGKDAAEQILLIDPHARLIVSSGYSDDPVMADYKCFGFHLSLPKPYKLSDLTEVLNTLRS